MLQVQLTRPQTKVHRWTRGLEAKGVRISLPWGRGTGKSRFKRWRAWEFVAAWDGRRIFPTSPDPGIRIVLFMPTLKQFRKVHADAIERELATSWKFLRGKFNKTDFRIRFPGGSWIQVLSAEQGTAIAGTRCDVIMVDECDDIDMAIYDALAGPWLSEPWSLQLVLFGGTPRRGRAGLLYRQHKRGLEGRPNRFTLHATYRDCPEIVDREHIESERREMSPALFGREYEANFDAAEGVVYPMFEHAFHVKPPDPTTWWTEIAIGVDHGWSHPGAFEIVGIAGRGPDAVAHVLGEVVKREAGEPWWCQQAREILDKEWRCDPEEIRWFPDPSSPSRIAALKEVGCKIGETNNAVIDGINLVSAMLAPRIYDDGSKDGRKYAKLYIDPSCTHLISELEGKYRRKRAKSIIDPTTGEAAIMDEPEDKDDDACDALRYALHSRLGRPRGDRQEYGPGDFSMG